MNSILDKRLYNDLREKQGLGYIVSSEIENYFDEGSITLHISSNKTNSEDIKKIYNGFNKHTKALTENLITKEELERAKSVFKKQMLALFEMPSLLHQKIAELNETNAGIQSISLYNEILESITPQDIQKAANYVFSTYPDYAIDANKEAIEKNINYFNNLAKTQ